jgi:predicted nucleic acid-binding protein
VLALQNDFLQHVEDEYIVITLESSILFRARQLVDQYPLRTLDAIHLSTAIHSISMLNEPMIFVTADARLLPAATAERFQVDNPYSH